MAEFHACLSALLVIAVAMTLATAARDEAACPAVTVALEGRAQSRSPADAQVEPSLGGETLLMQVHRGASDSQRSQSQRSFGVTTDCASKLNSWGKRNAACLVKDNERALLVYVPYGSAPGLDFPGGHRKDHEFACQTAERETCEETGHQVRAIRRLTYNVFLCEIVARDACREAVDEGFLRKEWVSKSQLDSLQYRGGTWGDKRAVLANNLGDSSGSHTDAEAPTHTEARDACACLTCQGQGFSSRTKTCASGSISDVREACACLQQSGDDSGGLDPCGCQPCSGEGWSSTRGRCRKGSDTSPQEACSCSSRSDIRCPGYADRHPKVELDWPEICQCGAAYRMRTAESPQRGGYWNLLESGGELE